MPPHTVLKTSSGKIRRATMRELYERKALEQGQRALRWQIMKLAVLNVWSPLRRELRKAGEFLYAGYAWVLLVQRLCCFGRASWCCRAWKGAGRWCAALPVGMPLSGYSFGRAD
ncbi:MAG: hypothetical protein R3F37_09290 [Candidatus Competibacteraceae bacterium]